MRFIAQSIPEVFLIEPKVIEDNRGYFCETFRADLFVQATGHTIPFIQENQSRSSKGVLRGLHFQMAPKAQSKLVRAVAGKILDVAVDIRSNSPTYGQHVSAVLDDHNHHQLFVPRGFAHGFIVLSEHAIVTYKVDNPYDAACDKGVFYADPALQIDWNLPQDATNVSDKDSQLPTLDALPDYFRKEVT